MMYSLTHDKEFRMCESALCGLLLFIYKCFFYKSNLVKFVVRSGVEFGRYKSVTGSNFHFCVARYRFSQSAFLNCCVNADSIARRYCSLLIDDKSFAVAQFLRDSILLCDTVGKNFGCYTLREMKLAVL